MTKEEKALEYAKEMWGIYFEDRYPDPAISSPLGEISQKDYLAGYEEGLKDSDELLEALRNCIEMLYRANDPGTATTLLARECEQLIHKL